MCVRAHAHVQMSEGEVGGEKEGERGKRGERRRGKERVTRVQLSDGRGFRSSLELQDVLAPSVCAGN